jgi:exonuclease VII large subunit
MKFNTFKNLRASIWAKSEHEFLKPMKVGSKVTISGRVVEKYEKRGRYYLVSEYETVDEKGEVLMRSRETGVNVE